MQCNEMFWFASFHVQTNKNEMGEQEHIHMIHIQNEEEEEEDEE